MTTEKKNCIDKLNSLLASSYSSLRFIYDEYWGDFLFDTNYKELHYSFALYPLSKKQLEKAVFDINGIQIEKHPIVGLSESQIKGFRDFRCDSITTLKLNIKESSIFQSYVRLVEEKKMYELLTLGGILSQIESNISMILGRYFDPNGLSFGGSHGLPLIRNFRILTQYPISFTEKYIILKNNKSTLFPGQKHDFDLEMDFNNNFEASRWAEDDNYVYCGDWIKFVVRKDNRLIKKPENVVLEIPKEEEFVSLLREFHKIYGLNDILSRKFLQYLDKQRRTGLNIPPSKYSFVEDEREIFKQEAPHSKMADTTTQSIRDKLKRLKDFLG